MQISGTYLTNEQELLADYVSYMNPFATAVIEVAI